MLSGNTASGRMSFRVRGFASASECREMLASMDALVEAWDPAETTSVFKTDASQSAAQGKDDYFMTLGMQ